MITEIQISPREALEELAERALLRRQRIDCERHPEWFHGSQKLAWFATQAIVAICAGWQSGKTVFLPPWLKREIQRKGPGDYGAFSSTYKLLERKFLPELKKDFKVFADYKAASMQFIFHEAGSRKLFGDKWNGEPTVIQLGHAENPDSLESATMKAVAWDEPGQGSIPSQSFLTVQSRLMVNRGRMCLSSRPYEYGWYQELVESGLNGTNSDVKVINFPSWENPLNPREDDPYWQKLRNSLPDWKFQLLYEGKFTRPAGAIYDCFRTSDTASQKASTCKRFDIPKHWDIYVGLDFGNINTAAVYLAEERDDLDGKPTGRFYLWGSYHDGGKSGSQHAFDIMKPLGRRPRAYGGSHQEDGWRDAFNHHGLYVQEPPINDVEVGILCVYGAVKAGKLIVFDDLDKVIAEFNSYSRELDDNADVTEKIKDKAKYHRLDALRYVGCQVFQEYAPIGAIKRFEQPKGRTFAKRF